MHYVALTFSELPAPADTDEAEDWMERTGEYWRQWLSAGHASRTTRGAAYLQSSALALKGLSYAPTGALLAAATTSLPETPGGERNWDYRYTWMRDSTFALWGLYTLGFDREANDFFFFIHDVCRDNPNDLQSVYGVGGRASTRGGRPGSPDRLRRLPPGADRQRRLQPAAARRLAVPCWTRSTCTPGPGSRCRRNCGRS